VRFDEPQPRFIGGLPDAARITTEIRGISGQTSELDNFRKPFHDLGIVAGASKRSVTIHDVAEAAGSSISTVSRSFHMPELVRPQTRDRVLEIAAGLGYTPNRAARGLITGRTGNLGLIVPDVANPFFPALVKAAQARARSRDYSLFLADTDEDPDAEAQLIRAMAKQVDGVIACSSRMSERKLREVAALTSLVLVNRRSPGVPSVSMDMAGGIRQAVEHLYALGHRSCVYLAGPRPSWSNRQRQKALGSIAERLGMAVTVLGPFEPGYQAGLRAADQALAERPTAILAYNDLAAVGALDALTEAGLDVPADVSLVGYDNTHLAAIRHISLTSVDQPREQMGRLAVATLDEAPSGRVHVLAPRLCVRRSSARPRA
jgi:DNA-binding LacI/PurR family transcriptional regulator